MNEQSEQYQSKAQALIARYGRLQSTRYNYESQWQEVRDLVRTTTSDFNRSTTKGDRRSEHIYDGTAPWALEQLAAGLNSSLSSPTDRYFNIGLETQETGLTDEQLAWCEDTADAIYKEYGKSEVNLNPSIHECYLDVGGFGTAVLYQEWDWDAGNASFKSFPLADCYIAENAKGVIDTMFRKSMMTRRQLEQEFSKEDDSLPSEIKDEKNETREFEIVHCVYPRNEGKGGYGPKNKKFASCWVIPQFKHLCRESGYDGFPYHVPRWTKLAGEVYGRSPGMTCLPDIKMLNQMSKVTIIAAQKIIDPPLIVPDDGFILPIKTSPGSLLFKSVGQEDTIQPLETKGRVDVGLELQDQRREQILKAFYVDWIIRQKKKERQTAAEVYDDRNEMLRQMAPMLGRITVELISPMIIRTYDLMLAAGKIKPAPASMQKKRLALYYVSPAAKAQSGSKAGNIQMFTQDLVAMAQAAPEVMDAIDVDVYAQEMAKYRDVTRKIIRSPDMIAQVRQDRKKQQNMANMAASGKDAASAIKDLSVAQKNGLPALGA